MPLSCEQSRATHSQRQRHILLELAARSSAEAFFHHEGHEGKEEQINAEQQRPRDTEETGTVRLLRKHSLSVFLVLCVDIFFLVIFVCFVVKPELTRL